jgi:hypothetical protein
MRKLLTSAGTSAFCIQRNERRKEQQKLFLEHHQTRHHPLPFKHDIIPTTMMMKRRSAAAQENGANRHKSAATMIVFEDPSGSSSSSYSGIKKKKNSRKRSRRMMTGSKDSSNSANSEMYGALFCCRRRCSLRSQSWMYTLLIIVLGAAACITVLVLGLQSAQQSSQKLFQNQAQEVVFSLRNAWREYETVLLWIHESCDLLLGRNTTTASSLPEQIGFCSRTDFAYLARHIDSLQLPMISIQFAPSITHAQRPLLEVDGRAFYEHSSRGNDPNRFPYLGITNVTFDEGELLERKAAPEQDAYFPVHYVHPATSLYNQAVLEMDLNSVPEIRQGIQQAFDTFQPAMGGRFLLATEDSDDAQWAVGILHPGIDEYEVLEGSAANFTAKNLQHHSVSRIVVRPADVIQYCTMNLDFPEKGGVSIFIFDEKDGENASLFLAGARVLDNGNVLYLEETQYETMEASASYSFGHLRTHQESVAIADHTWTVVVIPVGESYEPRFDFVILGAVLLFLSTILVTCLHHSTMARTSQLRAIKSESARDKARNALVQAQRERHVVSTSYKERENGTWQEWMQDLILLVDFCCNYRTTSLHMKFETLFHRHWQR